MRPFSALCSGRTSESQWSNPARSSILDNARDKGPYSNPVKPSYECAGDSIEAEHLAFACLESRYTQHIDHLIQPPNDTVTLSLASRQAGGQSSKPGDSIELDDFTDTGKRFVADEYQARHRLKSQRKLRELHRREAMKFSHSVQFNAVPDWSSHYISYSNLKKL